MVNSVDAGSLDKIHENEQDFSESKKANAEFLNESFALRQGMQPIHKNKGSRIGSSPLQNITKTEQEISKVDLEQAIGLFFDEMEKNKYTKAQFE
jgi:hypothetical protein